MEEIRILTIGELKKEIEENLEYAHPLRDTNPAFNGAFGIQHGFKPVVNNIFFETENEAVNYIFQNDELYKNIKDLANHTKIVENYDEAKDGLVYTLHYSHNTLTMQYNLFSLKRRRTLTYNFTFTKNMLTISNSDKKQSLCINIKNDDFEWRGETLENIFLEEHIVYPENIKNLFEYLWFSWKEDKINTEEVENEFVSLMDWIDAMTKNKPTSKFWNS